VPPGPPPGPPPAQATAQWPCNRCGDGTTHRLSACPNYQGCEHCGSKLHLQQKCAAQQEPPIKN
jgi:uncharacterized protein (DUF983 family)